MPQHIDQTIYRSDVVSITDVRCRPSGAEVVREEFSGSSNVVFVRRGLFLKHVARRELVANSNHVLFFNRHQPYQVTHPIDGGDDCTVLRFGNSVLADALRPRDERAADRENVVFAHTHGPANPAHLALYQALRASIRRGMHDEMSVDEIAIALLEQVLDHSYSIRNEAPTRRRVRGDTSRAQAELARATQLLMSARFAESMSLAQLARAVHSSPFHLARLFRRQTGTSIHQYRSRLRLAAALERLAEGTDDLTALALELGFSSHAHFSDTFRRTFGVAPSQFRRVSSAAALREMSTNLKAHFAFAM